MDETVLRAMQQWPNVPAVYGWLALDRRGNWLIKSRTGGFERITNAAMIEFIGRNYAHDDKGRWYFQNGPQQVFVSLGYTPWIYRLNDTATGLLSHAGAVPKDYCGLFLDDTGALLLQTEQGVGVFLDRDLSAILARVTGPNGENADALLDSAARGDETRCRLFERTLALVPVRASDVPDRFCFMQHPTPPAGQPDC